MCARKMRSKLGFPVVVGSLTLNLLCASRYASRMKEIELYGERRDDCSVIRHGNIDRLSGATTVYLRATACTHSRPGSFADMLADQRDKCDH